MSQPPEQISEAMQRAREIVRAAEIEAAAQIARDCLRQAESIDALMARLNWADPARLLILGPLLIPLLLACRLVNWIAGRSALRHLEDAIR